MTLPDLKKQAAELPPRQLRALRVHLKMLELQRSPAFRRKIAAAQAEIEAGQGRPLPAAGRTTSAARSRAVKAA